MLLVFYILDILKSIFLHLSKILSAQDVGNENSTDLYTSCATHIYRFYLTNTELVQNY